MAIATEDSLFYRVLKNKIDDIFFDHPLVRQHLTEHALAQNRRVTQQRLRVMKKNPILGLQDHSQLQQKNAIKNIKKIKLRLDELKKSIQKKNAEKEDDREITAALLEDEESNQMQYLDNEE